MRFYHHVIWSMTLSLIVAALLTTPPSLAQPQHTQQPKDKANPPSPRQPQPTPPPKDKANPKRPLLQIPGYQIRVIEGFTTIISDEVMIQHQNSTLQRKPLDVLELELKTMIAIMPSKIVNALRNVLIWVDWDDKQGMPNGRDGFALAIYSGGHQASLLREGRHPLRAKAVSILRMQALTNEHQPEQDSGRCVILHEMAHAVHFEVLGQDHAPIKAAYKQALERKLYDAKAYITTNEAEFFAESTCAYFNQLQYHPKDREALKRHDPVTYKLMESIWGKSKEAASAVASEKDGANPLDYRIEQLPSGPLLDGQPFDLNTLAGQPVLAYLWNASNLDSLTALPKINALHTELSDFGLVTLGIHMTGTAETPLREETRKRQLSFPVLDARWNNHLFISKFKDFPKTIVFDHTGQCLYAGSAFDAEQSVREAVGRAILHALGDAEASKALAPITDALAKGKSPSTLLPQLAFHARSRDMETANAAKQLIVKITEPGQRILAEAETLAKTQPVDAYLLAERLPPVYRDTLVASKANDLLSRLKQDKAVALELRARPSLSLVQKLDTELQSRPGSFDPLQPKFRIDNALALKQLSDAVSTLQKSYGKTRAAEQAREIARRYGLSQ
jgi:hypothetical protein